MPSFYWASGCGHAAVFDFKLGDEFPPCKTCGKPIWWIIQKGFLHESYKQALRARKPI